MKREDKNHKIMETTLNSCPALKLYIDYWDEWHKEWYNNASSKPPKLSPIKGWPIPSGNGGTKSDIWRYFPEPYWGNPNSTELTAVFLNLNPAGGDDDQDIIISTKDPIVTYNAYYQLYSATVAELIKNPCYPTTEWFNLNRVYWLNCLLYHLKKLNNKTISNIIAGELVPWHTKSSSHIKSYVSANIKLIDDRCIKPLAEISQCADFKGVVFCRGAEVANALTMLTKKKKLAHYTNGKMSIHIFEYHDAIFIVFVGGRNMSLPKLCEIYNSSKSHKSVSVHEIVNGCLTKSFV